jgi:hypothetical protein
MARSVSRLLTVERSDPAADVLVVTNSWPHEREPRYGIFVQRKVDALIDAGVRCDVLFVRGFESPLAYAAAALRLLRLGLARRPRYRLVHGHGGETVVPCVLHVRGRRVVSFYGDDLMGTPRPDGSLTLVSRVKRVALRNLARLCTATITQSRQMEDTLPGPVRRRNVVMPSGVNRDLFRPIDRDEARRDLGWDDTGPVALFAADPELPRKRYALAEAACEEARRRGFPVRLHVAASVAPDRMPVVMSAADCLLLPSKVEGSPNVVKEAVMCNLPVVATDAGDVREVLDPVTPSFVCEASGEALGEALAACLEAGRSNGREVSERLDERRLTAELRDLLESLAGGGAPALAAGR